MEASSARLNDPWQRQAAPVVVPVELIPAASLGADTNSTGTALSIKSRGATVPWQETVALGKALQVRVVAAANAGASSTLVVSVVLATAALGGVLTDDTNEFASVSTGSTTVVAMDSGWVPIDTALLAVTDFASINMSIKRTGVNNGTVKAGATIFYRWA